MINTILIIWNKSEDELNAAMEALITANQWFLFDVIVNSSDSAGYKWAIQNGAPIKVFKMVNNTNQMIKDLVRITDYVIIDSLTAATPAAQLLLKRMQIAGKHGKVV